MKKAFAHPMTLDGKLDLLKNLIPSVCGENNSRTRKGLRVQRAKRSFIVSDGTTHFKYSHGKFNIVLSKGLSLDEAYHSLLVALHNMRE